MQQSANKRISIPIAAIAAFQSARMRVSRSPNIQQYTHQQSAYFEIGQYKI